VDYLEEKMVFSQPDVLRLQEVEIIQHQAITNITKHSIQQRIFRMKIRK
jgi:hypothetical protein